MVLSFCILFLEVSMSIQLVCFDDTEIKLVTQQA